MVNLLPFIIILFIIAAFMRLDFLLYILYVFFGLYLLSRWWVRQAMQRLRFTRSLATERAFLGEKVPVEVEVLNSGLLPLPWLHLRENLPLDLHVPNVLQRVVSLLPRERETIRFELHGWRRGYYAIGPLSCRAGDLFGVTEVVRQGANWPEIPERKMSEIEEEMKKIFERLDQKAREEGLDNLKGYRLAIEFEKKGYEMYTRFSETAGSEREKRFFAALAEEEEKHLEALDNVYHFLTESEDWLTVEESKVWNWMSA